MDLRISELPALAPADLRDVDLLALADLSASETKKLSAKDLIQYGVAFIDDESIPSEKLADVRHEDLAPTTGPALFLAGPTASAGRVSARRIAPLDLPPATTTTLGAVVVSAGLAVDASGALQVQPASTAAIGGVIIDSLGGLETDTSGVLRHVNNQIPSGTRSGISYDEWGHITGAVALVGSDLPAATQSTLGGVSIPTDSGLTVSALGELRHSHTITAQTVNGISIDTRGHVTALVPLTATDIPLATNNAVGGVKVPSDSPLRVDGSGSLRHASTTATTGTFTKVTVDGFGHVTGGDLLTAADIPNLDASQITTGTLATSLFEGLTITGGMIGDYATAFIQEALPNAPDFTGQLWLQESSAQLRMWNGNSWMPCGFGAVMQNNLRYAGAFDASTGTVTLLTQLGRESGFVVGQALPSPTALNAGCYLIALVAGSGVVTSPGTAFDVGDWILSIGQDQQWVRVDIIDGGSGGGGGSFSLNDALDVSIANPQAGQTLVYDAQSAQWRNAVASDPGFF